VRGRKRDARCGKKGRNKTQSPDAIGGCCPRSSGAASLGRKVGVTSPVAKKIHDDTVLPKLGNERRYIVLKECPDKGTELFLALIHRCLGSAKQGPTFRELRQIFVNGFRHGLGIGPRRKRFKRRSTIVDVHAVLLNALSCLKTLSLLTG
jgi:hypothetical protein